MEGWSTRNDGVWGISTDASGVHGVSEQRGTGVVGESKDGRGVHGISGTFQGVFGQSTKNAGIAGDSREFHAIFGVSHSSHNGGVIGINESGGWGVIGRGASNTGVSGESTSGRGVHGISETGEGVHGQTNSPTAHAVVAFHHAAAGTGAAIYAEKVGDVGHAGFFVGNVHVTKNLTVDKDIVLTGADCAEEFDIATADPGEPGTVLVLGEEGALHPSQSAYDKRVVGVISGAGDYRPGLVLDKQCGSGSRKPIALLGKVFCKVDASLAPVAVGDLLTTSGRLGHAMKATDPATSFGAVIGKALRPLHEGQGLIPILVTLQ